MAKSTVSSGEFLKRPGRIGEAAQREPAPMTRHGSERLAPLSADACRRLKRNDRAALYPWELANADVRALAVSEPPPGAGAFDGEVDST